jgi:hypothetical protein
MTVEQRLDQLEKRNKRLTVALTMTVVAMCAVVTVAATGDKDGYFDTVQTRKIWVTNDAGDTVVSIGANDYGDGLVYTSSAKGKELVSLSAAESDYGMVTTYQPNGKKSVGLSGTENGGAIVVFNKTGETIVTLDADEYGNGEVGAWNRKGKGRTLKPGP